MKEFINKNKSKFAIIFILFICSMMLMTSMVSAESYTGERDGYMYCHICREYHNVEKLRGVQITAAKWIDRLYSGDIIGESEGGKVSTYDILKFDVSSGTLATLWARAKTIYDVMMPIGNLLVIVYVFMELMELVTTDNVNPEMIVRALIKMTVGMMIITNGFDIITDLSKLASQAFNSLTQHTGFTGMEQFCPINGSLVNVGRKPSFAKGFMGMAENFIPYLIAIVIQFCISILCWARVLDIIIKVMFAPIGIADLSTAGTQGSGFAYLKNLFASMLQGAVIVAILIAYGQVLIMVNSTPTEGIPSYVMMITCSIVALVATFKSQAYASEITG